MLRVNADDLGLTEETTNRILACYEYGRIHSASAMTFMKDSERAAELSRMAGIETGLHLNLTQALTADRVPNAVLTAHSVVARYLGARKINQLVLNPFLRSSFDFVFQAQWDEYTRLFRREPERIDGHHHMHLCMNMLLANAYPAGIRIRRNFSFFRGEKHPINRLYRQMVDRRLCRRFRCGDFFFSLQPQDRDRLNRIAKLAIQTDVEVMVHPGWDDDFHFLMSSEWAAIVSVHRHQIPQKSNRGTNGNKRDC